MKLDPISMTDTLRRSFALVAVYAIFCVGWSILNWMLSGHQDYLGGWAVISGAVPLAAILHLIVVLYIERIRHKRLALVRERKWLSSGVDAVLVPDARVDAALILVSAVFFALVILSGVQADYEQYVAEWMDILAGRDPWNRGASSFNAYGPLFNVLAPLVWISPLAPKLLFAFSHLVYVTWLIQDFWPRRRLAVLSWRWVTFWLLFPFPWVEIGYLGFFDSLVALSCVAAVHARVKSKDVVSGISLAVGILLKYMPLVLLPFLAFDERRVRVRFIISCIVCVVVGLLTSFLIWGPSTFTPLMFAATRRPLWSLYQLLESIHSPLRWFWDSPSVEWLEKPFLLTSQAVLFVWYMRRRPEPALAATLAILVTLLLYRVGVNNYQIVLFYLISYWAVSDWQRLRENLALVGLLASYFALLAMIDLSYWLGFGYIYYSTMVVVLFKFVMGCVLVAALVKLSSRRQIQTVSD